MTGTRPAPPDMGSVLAGFNHPSEKEVRRKEPAGTALLLPGKRDGERLAPAVKIYFN